MSARRSVRTVVAGLAAFGLVAAAASGTAFSVNSVEGIAVASSASGSFDVQPCDGAFDVTWTVVSGEIVGVRAVRVAPSSLSDPGLKYCADMPYAILVADRDDVMGGDGEFDLGHASWVVEWTGVTDASTGSIDASSTEPVSGPLQLAVGTAVQLAIGPDPLNLTFAGGVPVTPAGDCESLASGGTSSAVSIDGDEFCVHVFDTVGTETFEVLDARVTDVDVLVVGGGGGGGAGAFGEVLDVVVGAGTSWTVEVGAGGAGGVETGAGAAGSASRITDGGTVIDERSGGGGGSGSQERGPSGASGGGGSGSQDRGEHDEQRGNLGGVGTGDGIVIDGVRQNCGADAVAPTWCGGGGGGAGGEGGSPLRGQDAGDGGVGAAATILSGPVADLLGVGEVLDGQVFFAAGGGGGIVPERVRDAGAGLFGQGLGGLGGGGSGAAGERTVGAGLAASGSGGGGGGASDTASGPGGAGGSGVVIIRYPEDGGSLLLNIDATVAGGVEGSTWVDRSGSGRDGTLVGDVAFDEATGSIVFPGGSNGTSFVDLAGSFTDFSGGFTVEFEADFGEAVFFERIFGFAEAPGTTGNAFALVRLGSTNELAIEAFDGGTSIGRCHTATGGTALSGTGFQKWTVTIGVNSVCRMYLDGVPQPTRVTSGTTDIGTAGADTDGSLYRLPPVVERPATFIGRSNFLPDGDFKGSIRYVRIFATERRPPDDVAQ